MSSNRELLESSLQDCVVPISAPGRVGTGFFVGPRLVLTCWHVVAPIGTLPKKDSVEATWQGRRLTLNVIARSATDDDPADLILLAVAEKIDNPFVLLGVKVQPGDALWSFGHPSGSYRAGDSADLKYSGRSSRGDGTELLKAGGGPVDPGFSGAPVLNWRTGTVCGMVRLAQRNPAVTRLVATSAILAAYPELGTYHRPPYKRNKWIEMLDDGQIAAEGLRYPGPSMKSYLDAVRQAARDHPYTVTISDLPALSSVYLRQYGREIGTGGNDDLIDLPGPRSSGVDVSVSAASLFSHGRNALVVGGPGAGKSSLLRYVSDVIAREWIHRRTADFVPVYVTASALTGDLQFSRLLARAVRAELSTWLDTEITENWLADEPLPGVPWLLLVDGIDEIVDPRLRRLMIEKISSRRNKEQYRFLVASRPLPEKNLEDLHKSGTGAFEILPFSDEQIIHLARKWFIRKRLPEPTVLATRFRRELKQSQLAHLARVPLIATMLCVVFADNVEQGIPGDRPELYERFISVLLAKQYEKVDIFAHLGAVAGVYGHRGTDAVNALLERTRGVLSEIAFRGLKGGSDPILDTACELVEELRPALVPAGKWRAMVSEALRQTGLVVETRSSLVFLHRTIQEYLAADHAAERLSEQRIEDIVFPAAPGRWNQSFRSFLVAAAIARGRLDIRASVLGAIESGDAQAVLFAASLLDEGITLPHAVSAQLTNRLLRLSGADRVRVVERVQAAHYLARFEPTLGKEALATLLSDTRIAPYDKYEAASRLVELNYRDGVATLMQFAEHPRMPVELRTQAAERLLDLDPGSGLACLDRLVRDSRINGNLRFEIAAKMSAIDANQFNATILAAAQDGDCEDFTRIRFLELLRDRAPATAREALVAVIPDSRTSDFLAASAFELLSEDRPHALPRINDWLVLNAAAPSSVRKDVLARIIETNPRAGRRLADAFVLDETVSGFDRAEVALLFRTTDPAKTKALLDTVLSQEECDPFLRGWIESLGEIERPLSLSRRPRPVPQARSEASST